MTTFDLTAAKPVAQAQVRLSAAALWFGGWTAFVLGMAGVVSTQKSVPFVYTFRSEGINYYTLAAASLVVWFASARMSALRWPLASRFAAHVTLGLVLITVWQAVYASYMWSVMGPMVWDKL